MFRECWNRLRLNLRAARLAASGVWMDSADVAASYDCLAATYDRHWAVRLCDTTNRLHERLPETLPEDGVILELGCGSGGSTVFLRNKYAESPLVAVDVSPRMIELAEAKLAGAKRPVEFHVADMLAFLRQRPDNTAGLIFSGWAIGYSRPTEIVAEAARVLKPGGRLAVVVNRLETLPAVFDAFRRTLRQYPQAVNKALWPRFPKGAALLTAASARNGLCVEFFEEAAIPIEPPPENRLNWLLGTGILAGFDAVLPLREPGVVQDFFANTLDQTETGWEHRYIMLIAAKSEPQSYQAGKMPANPGAG